MTKEKRKFFKSIILPATFILLIIVIKILEVIFELNFISLSLYPRNPKSLLGIITSPLIHKNFEHLFSNIFPLMFLGISINYFYKESSKKVFLISYIITGFFVWVFARESFHIGASGIVYALVSFLFFSGIIKKDKRSITLSLLVVFLYGGLIYGIFPIKEGVSWESHLIGGLVGMVTAIVYRKKDLYKKYNWEKEELRESIRDLEVSYKKGYQGETKEETNENSN